MTTSLTVCEGDGILVIRGHTLENVIACPNLKATLTDAQVLIVGLSWALGNDEWRNALMERTRTRIAELRDSRGLLEVGHETG